MWMTENEIREILQGHKKHLLECKREDRNTMYWIGALDCVDNLALEFGVELEWVFVYIVNIKMELG